MSTTLSVPLREMLVVSDWDHFVTHQSDTRVHGKVPVLNPRFMMMLDRLQSYQGAGGQICVVSTGSAVLYHMEFMHALSHDFNKGGEPLEVALKELYEGFFLGRGERDFNGWCKANGVGFSGEPEMVDQEDLSKLVQRFRELYHFFRDVPVFYGVNKPELEESSQQEIQGKVIDFPGLKNATAQYFVPPLTGGGDERSLWKEGGTFSQMYFADTKIPKKAVVMGDSALDMEMGTRLHGAWGGATDVKLLRMMWPEHGCDQEVALWKYASIPAAAPDGVPDKEAIMRATVCAALRCVGIVGEEESASEAGVVIAGQSPGISGGNVVRESSI